MVISIGLNCYTFSANAEMDSHTMIRVNVLISTNVQQIQIFAMKMLLVTMILVDIHVDAIMASLEMDMLALRHRNQPKLEKNQHQLLLNQ